LTELLTKSKRQHLKQLIIECQLRRFTPAESLVYIRDKLGVAVSERHYYTIKKQVLSESIEEMNYYQDSKGAFANLYFEQIAEARNSLKEMWNIFYDSDKEDWNRRLKCLLEIREQAAFLNTLYDYIPDLAAVKLPVDNKPTIAPYQDEVVRTARYLKEHEFDEERVF
jgi:tRNA G37 N-methylase Trm5